MKLKMRVLLIMFLFVPISAHSATTSLGKLGRGFVNVVTAPIEIPKQARSFWIEGAQVTDHILIWVGTGTVWGVVQTIKRASSGVWDVVSFPFRTPEDYQPLLKPDYVFEDWPSDPNVFIFKKKLE